MSEQTRSLAARPARLCLGCDSDKTTRHGRVLTCSRCEVTYYIPAVQLRRPTNPA